MESFAQRCNMLAVFFVLEKAYETTWELGILAKLFKRSITYLHTKRFLADRKFRVRVGNSFSNLEDQLKGVPQESVLSATLWPLL